MHPVSGPLRQEGTEGGGGGVDVTGPLDTLDRRHPDLFSPGEAAEYLRLPEVCGSMMTARKRLNELCHDGQIPCINWGKARLFHQSALDDFVARHAVPSAVRADGQGPCGGREPRFEADGQQDGQQDAAGDGQPPAGPAWTT